jgi:hypothetical protein
MIDAMRRWISRLILSCFVIVAATCAQNYAHGQDVAQAPNPDIGWLDQRFHETDHISGYHGFLVNRRAAATSHWNNVGGHMIQTMETLD